MKNLNQEVFRYVDSKSGSWADSTISTAYHKLSVVAGFGLTDPQELYQRLSSKGLGRYSIQSYLILASRFEKEVRNTNRIEKWLQDNRNQFKNCYKTKTRKISKDQFERFLEVASPSPDLWNFLVLMGRFGLRKSEALNAKWEDFTAEGTLEIKNGKGDKQRFIPLSVDNLKNFKQEGLILPRGLNYWRFFATIKPFTPHDFRAYAITSWVKEKGLDLSDAALLAGHSKTDTTNRYVRTDLVKIGEKLK